MSCRRTRDQLVEKSGRVVQLCMPMPHVLTAHKEIATLTDAQTAVL